LHYALDLGFERVVKAHCHGEAMMCRYADDWGCAFRYKRDAERDYAALPKRLGTFSVTVEPSKPHIPRVSRFHGGMERRFSFLGFEFFWFPDRKGIPRVTRRTAGKKLRAALKRITEWIRLNRHKPKHWFYQQRNVK
jgi:RNA-directed DNA polymerase